MKSFYEQYQDNVNSIAVVKGPSFIFPPHFHQKLEIFALTKGKYTVTKNGEPILLHAGDIAIFDSYDIHAYIENHGGVQGVVLIIPPVCAKGFFARKSDKNIISSVISDSELCEKIYSLTYEYIVPISLSDSVKQCTAELILSLLEPKLVYGVVTNNETTLALDLLRFIHSNFQADINLDILSKKFGYSKEHISRVFHRYVRSGIPSYVNELRLKFMDDFLKNDKSLNITTLLFQAGFNSIQSYYRAKSKRK